MSGAGKARILILTYTDFAREPRALKQAKYLRADNEVVTAGFGAEPVDGVTHIELPDLPPHPRGHFGRLVYLVLLTLRAYRLLARLSARDRAAYRLLGSANWDIVIAHDVQTIALANRLTSRAGVIADLHEYAPRQNDHSRSWRLLIAPYFRWLCRNEVAKATAVVTVSQGIVDEYRREFGFEARLVVNATPYEELAAGQVVAPLRLVHSGTASPARKIETLIEAVGATTSDVTLDLYLMDDRSEYLAGLRLMADKTERVRFRDPVVYSDLISTLNGYDVGISILAPINFNHIWALPNKFFDYVQARLGIIIGPSPEMRRIVEQYGVGAVMPDFETSSLVRLLDTLTIDQVVAWKTASARSAHELSSEKQMDIWGALTQELLRAAA